jgi:RNA polymerase sigma-B factor
VPTPDDVRSPADRTYEDLDLAALEFAGRRAVEPSIALRDSLVRRCLPLAGRLARRYRGRGEPLEDLEQVARLGLVKAVDRYDPERGSFTAYAVITISGEIKRHFRDRTWGVHVPRRIQDLSLEVSHARMVLTSSLSRTPTTDEIAERLGVEVAAVTEALGGSAAYAPTSLNAPVSDGDGEFGDMLGGADLDLESVDDKLTVSGLLLRLPGRERRMLALRFYGNRTQAEIAAELGISQMHVSRLLSRALAWLREAMLSDIPPRWEGTTAPSDHHGMRLSVARDGGVLTVRVRGEVDRDTAERLRVSLRHGIGTAGPDMRVVVDLAGVPLVDAAGIAVLLDAASSAGVAGVGLTIEAAQPYVSRILSVSGLAPLMR